MKLECGFGWRACHPLSVHKTASCHYQLNNFPEKPSPTEQEKKIQTLNE